MNHRSDTTMDETTTDLADEIGTVFLTRLLETPEGRAHMLNISVAAEEGDESGLFDQVAAVVDEPELRRIVELHRDDEVRHAGLFRGCLERNGYEADGVPDSIAFIREVGGRSDRSDDPVRGVDDLVDFFALLLAIEERGVQQFPRLADLFEPHDPETAAVYRRVARDERGHVRYCERIGRHYAPDDQAWDDAVARARALEQEAFLSVGLANLAYCTDHGLVQMDDIFPTPT
jgi:rubrerythrin